MNIFIEKNNLPLDIINSPHEQKKNDLDWVRKLDKKLKIDYEVWCHERKIIRKKYE